MAQDFSSYLSELAHMRDIVLDKHFLKTLDHAPYESQWTAVPKVKTTPELISLLQEALAQYPDHLLIEGEQGSRLFFVAWVLAHEGSRRSAEVIEDFANRPRNREVVNLPGVMWRNLSCLGKGKDIKRLEQYYHELDEAQYAASELGHLLKQIGITVANPFPPKPGWSREILVAEEEPPAYAGAPQAGPYMRFQLEPYFASVPWEVSVIDAQKGRTYITGNRNGEPLITQNDLSLPILKSLVDLPGWIEKISVPLGVTFNIQKAKISGTGTRPKKDENGRFISWLCSKE